MNDFGMPRLVLGYVHDTVPHTIGVRLMHGVDPLDGASLLPVAIDLVSALITIQTNTVTYTEAFTQSRYGLRLVDLAYTGGDAGLNGVPAGYSDFRSQSLTVVGRSLTIGSSGHVGHTLLRVFGTSWFHVAGEEKQHDIDTIDTTGDLRTVLNSSTKIWADFYGSKCSVRPSVKLQFNAAIQRAYGS